MRKITLQIFSNIVISLFILSCHSHTPVENKKEEYTLIKDGLYKDRLCNLYFKSIDVSDYKKPIDVFLHSVWSEEFGVHGTRQMKDVIDAESFEAVGDEYHYYKDKNHIYFFHPTSDGGTISVVEEADLLSFTSFESSHYGKDNYSAFYKGNKINNADAGSFKPIYIEDSDRKIGWYAKDRFNYYDAMDTMSIEEIVELTELKKELSSKAKQHSQ